jgi:hypothetical protein
VAGLVQGIGIALFTVLFGSALAWIVGTQVSYRWDERRRQRESDLEALSTFYRLYGEFFATWKLWSSLNRFSETVQAPSHIHWDLLERAAAIEGGFEALFVKLASERKLCEFDQRMLGCLREAEQMLRESIRANKPLNLWASDTHDDGSVGFKQYAAFKALAEYLAFLLELSPMVSAWKPRRPRPTQSQAIAALREITNRGDYYKDWWTLATHDLGLTQRLEVKSMR